MSETYPVKVLPHRIHPTLKDCVTLIGSQDADSLSRKRSRDFRPAGFSVTLTGPSGEINKVPLYLPLFEPHTQVMVTLLDDRLLGTNAPVCADPLICKTPGITVKGPNGTLSLSNGLHIPKRRVYFRPRSAKNPYLREDDLVFVAPSLGKMGAKTSGGRVLIFGDVVVKFSTDYTQGFYIDAEEAAAANLTEGDQVRIIGKPVQPEFRSDTVINRKKRLITENDVRRAIMDGGKIEVESWMIVTPAAQELGREHNVFKEH
ncbi:hypothetical protein ACFL6I_00040 [candidate division KSB1 bacterium]